MKKNRDFVFIADPDELALARRHSVLYRQHKVAELLAFLESPQFAQGGSALLNGWFESNQLTGEEIQQQLLREIQESKTSIKESCVTLIMRKYRVDLIRQYEPLLCSILPDQEESQLIRQMQRLDPTKIVASDIKTLHLFLLDMLPQSSPVCEAVSLLNLGEMLSNEALIDNVSELIRGYDRDQRKAKTANEALKCTWINGKKIIVKDSNRTKDPLTILEEKLKKAGLANTALIEFILEYLNSSGMLLAYDYYDDMLQKNLNQTNEGSSATYLEINAAEQTVIVKLVRTYRKFSWAVHQDNSREKNLYAVNAQSTIVLGLSMTENRLDLAAGVEFDDNQAVSVELCGGAFEVFDSAIRTAVIQDLARGSVRKIINGEIADKNDQIILDQLLVDYMGIRDHVEIVRKLIVDKDPLKIFLIARANDDVMRELEISYELLMCFCVDQYAREYLESLKFLYPYSEHHNEVAMLIKFIKQLHDDNTSRMEKYNYVLKLLSPPQPSSSNKLSSKVLTEMPGQQPLTKQDLMYVVLALHTLRQSNEIISSPFKSAAMPRAVVDAPKNLRASDIITLLKLPTIRNRFDELWVINLAMAFEEIAKWMVESAEILSLRTFTHDHLCDLLKQYPGLWAHLQSPKSNTRDLTLRLQAPHLQRLAINNSNALSKEQATVAVCKDESLVAKLFRSEEDPNELLRYLGDFSSVFKKTTVKNYEDRISELVEKCDEYSIDYYFYKMFLSLSNEEFSERFQALFCKKQNDRESGRTRKCVKNALIAILCERVKLGRIAPDLWKSDYVLSPLVKELSQEPRLACLLRIDKVRSFLVEADRGYAMAFAECVAQNQLNPELRDVDFQISALTILKSADFRAFLLNPLHATFVINLIIKDHEAIELLIAAGMKSDGHDINLILKHASAQQLVLLLLAITARKNQYINSAVVNKKMSHEWGEKILQCQRLIELHSASANVAEGASDRGVLKPSPPPRKPGLSSGKLEELRATLASNEGFVREVNKQIEAHERRIIYIDNIIKKILESTTYLQRLLVSKEFSAIDLACLINLYPDIVARIVAGQLHEKYAEVILEACISLRPLLSATTTRVLSNAHPSINTAILVAHEEKLNKSISYENRREIEAVVAINDGNLLCETLIRILRSNKSADEILYSVSYHHHILHVLIDPMSVSTDSMCALLEELLAQKKLDFLRAMVNGYLISAFASYDILAGIISTPRMRDIIIQQADLSLLAKLICLIDMRSESRADWLPFYDRFVQEPEVLRVYKSVIDFHYHESGKMFFHVFAEGARQALENVEIEALLQLNDFHIYDFIKLLVLDYQANRYGSYRKILFNNNALLDEVVVAANADELATMLIGEITFRQGGPLEDQSQVEALLRTGSVCADIFRYASVEAIIRLIQLDSSLISQAISVRKQTAQPVGIAAQEDPLLQQLLRLARVEQFIELALDCQYQYRPFNEYLMELKLQDVHNIQLIYLLIIAQQQHFDWENSANSEFGKWLQNGDRLCETILTNDTPPTLVLRAVRALYEYLPATRPAVQKCTTGSLFHTILAAADLNETVEFLVSEQGKSLVFPNEDSDKPSSNIHNISVVIYRLYLLCNETQLRLMSRISYMKVFLKKLPVLAGDFVVVQRLVAPRIIALVDNLYQRAAMHAENVFVKDTYLINLIVSSRTMMCLLTGSTIYQSSERLRQVFIGQSPAHKTQPLARSPQRAREVSRARNQSEGSVASAISQSRGRSNVYGSKSSQGDSDHSSSPQPGNK
jgi:hypothetical protein